MILGPAQRSGTEYPARKRVQRAGPLQRHHRAAVDRDRLHPSRLEGDRRQRAQQRPLPGKALPDLLRREPVYLRLHLFRDLLQRVAAGQRRQHLPTDAPAASLDAAFVVPLAGPGEARFEGVVTGQRGEALAQPETGELHPPHRRTAAQSCRRQFAGHAAEVGEGAHVPVEEGELVLALIELDIVAARVHQPEQQQPDRTPLAGQVDPDLEDVDLRALGRAVDQRHVDLGPPSAPLAQLEQDQGQADLVAPLALLPVQAAAGDPLLGRGPLRPLLQQLLQPRPDLNPGLGWERCRCCRSGTGVARERRPVFRASPISRATLRWLRPSTNTLRLSP